jgi:chitinase
VPADPATLGDINVLNLAFYVFSRGGANHQADKWATRTDQKAVVDAYHKAGKVILLSVFGAEDKLVTSGVDPMRAATELADFVKKNNLDGVDIDLEGFEASSQAGAQFTMTLTNQLRTLLGPDYLSTHAPQGPYFSTGWTYMDVHKGAGSNIDFYNIQYYNQGPDNYVTCDDLIISSKAFPGTSIGELTAAGIPAQKLVLGKPMLQSDANNEYVASPGPRQVCCAGQGHRMAWLGHVLGAKGHWA